VQILSSRLEQVEKERNRALGANRELIAQLGTALAESKRFQQAAINERQCRLQLERTVELLEGRRQPIPSDQLKLLWRAYAPLIGGIIDYARAIERQHGIGGPTTTEKTNEPAVAAKN
jgi:hypothetical protein